jgi:hypothetical protein
MRTVGETNLPRLVGLGCWVRRVSYSYFHTSSSARYSPLLDIGFSYFLPFRSIFGYSHPAPASRPAQTINAELP